MYRLHSCIHLHNCVYSLLFIVAEQCCICTNAILSPLVLLVVSSLATMDNMPYVITYVTYVTQCPVIGVYSQELHFWIMQ